MGCHGHGHWGYGGWHGDCWGPGPGYGYGYGCSPRWDAEGWFAEPVIRGPYGRRMDIGRYAASRASRATATQLEAHLAALRDEARAIEADLAEVRAAGEHPEI